MHDIYAHVLLDDSVLDFEKFLSIVLLVFVLGRGGGGAWCMVTGSL